MGDARNSLIECLFDGRLMDRQMAASLVDAAWQEIVTERDQLRAVLASLDATNDCALLDAFLAAHAQAMFALGSFGSLADGIRQLREERDRLLAAKVDSRQAMVSAGPDEDATDRARRYIEYVQSSENAEGDDLMVKVAVALLGFTDDLQHGIRDTCGLLREAVDQRDQLQAVISAARDWSAANKVWLEKARGEGVSPADEVSRNRAATATALLRLVDQLDETTDA